MPIICLCGKKGSGKDTAAESLPFFFNHSNVCYSFELWSLAGEMKSFLCELNIPGLDFECFFGASSLREIKIPLKYKDTTKLVSPRDLLRAVGASLTDIWPVIFVHGLYTELKERPDNDIHVVTDVRYRHEYEFLKERGAKFIRIIRPSLEATDDHITETDMDRMFDKDFDAVIVNDGTIAELAEKAQYAILGLVTNSKA
jgi:hypothetical protein